MNIRENDIGAEGAKALADALKFNAVLTTLELYRNGIGAEGAVAMTDALKVNVALTFLKCAAKTRLPLAHPPHLLPRMLAASKTMESMTMQALLHAAAARPTLDSSSD